MASHRGSPRGLLMSGRFCELEDALLERLRDVRDGRPLAPVTVVVGSAALRGYVTDLLIRRLGAIANVSVVTLSRLATDLVARELGAPPRQLSGLARERLVGRVVARERAGAGLRFFGPVSERPHFARALAATFEDLRQGLVEPCSRWAVASSRAKAADLERLYAAYCAELARAAAYDDAAILAAATRRVEACLVARSSGGAPLAGRHPQPSTCSDGDLPAIVLYGFYDLNEAQAAFVRALLAAGADLLAPWPRAGGDEGAPALQIARAAGLAQRRRDAPPPAGDLDRVAAVFSLARAPAAATRLTGDDGVAVVSVPDERAEVAEAVREIITAVERGAPGSWDCAIVAPCAEDVERYAAGLARAGLPVACRRPDDAAVTRLLRRFLDCLAPAAGKPFSRRAVLDLFSVATPRAVGAGNAFAGSALWAQESRAAGVVSGLDQWADRLARRRRGLGRRLEELAAGGRAADEDGRARLRRELAATSSLEVAAASLATVMADLPEQATWSEWADWLTAMAGRVFEHELAAAVGDVVARLRTLAVVDEAVAPGEMASVLRRQIDDARAPAGRVGRDGVAVLTPLDVRGLRFHTVVIAGLAEGGFPARGRQDPILTDDERRGAAKSLGRRLPLAADRDAESVLLFALACEAARARLVLLAPRTEAASGRPRLPSRLLLRLAASCAGRPVGLEEFLGGAPLRPVWRRVGGRSAGPATGEVWIDARERDVAVLLDLDGGPAAGEYLRGLVREPSEAARRLAAWRAWRDPTPGSWDGLLGGDARRALAVRDPFAAELHPTALERYLDCPFRFLLRDVLGLSAPEEPGERLEIDAPELGALAHEILERVFAEVIAGDLGLGEALVRVEAVHADCCARAERRGVTGDDLSWEARRAALLEDLLEAVRRDPVFHGDGRPALVEWRFGEAAARPVSLALPDGRRVRFAGRIDRIDRTARGVRVVDYKTGKGETERRRVNAGLSVQLPVYRLAVAQGCDLGGAGSGRRQGEIDCLYQAVTRRGSFKAVPLAGSPAESETRLAAVVSSIADLQAAGVFARAPAGRCEHCDVRYACGASAWTLARKRRDQRLASLIALQSGQTNAEGATAEGNDEP